MSDKGFDFGQADEPRRDRDRPVRSRRQPDEDEDRPRPRRRMNSTVIYVLMIIGACITFLFGMSAMDSSKTVIHQILAAQGYVVSAVLFCGAMIYGALTNQRGHEKRRSDD